MQIPERAVYKRKEVMGITKLDGRVLDFWEREFPDISPKVLKDGEKTYTRKDLLLILQIRKWMVEERFSRQEVKRLLAESGGRVPAEGEKEDKVPVAVAEPEHAQEESDTPGPQASPDNVHVVSEPQPCQTSPMTLEQVREGLREILRLLERP